MVKPVLVPTMDVNSASGVIVAWKVPGGAQVQAGQIVADVETSKAVIEVPAPEAGFLLPLASEGSEVPLDAPIAELFSDMAALQSRAAHLAAAAAEPTPAAEVRATVKAKKRAEELGVDLASLKLDRLITEKDVEAASAPDYSAMHAPLSAAAGVERVLIIGAGRGATQVIDIFRGAATQVAVAILDDDRTRWGEEIYGVPVVGGTDRLSELFGAGAFDGAIIAISTSIRARTKLREKCASLSVPLANAIDATAKIASETKLGRGNVICAFCQIGTSTVVGDNNFLSAYNSYDHHNVLGSDISAGPGVVTSSRCKVGDRVHLGTGIFMEPGVELGADVQVASGAILLRSVPASHAVKTKIVTTTVVPLRK